MTFVLLLAAVAIFVCIGGNRLSQRLGVPTLLVFLVLGMLFGSDGIFRIPFDNYLLAENICTAALIFIMFYGGFGTNWSAARGIAVRAGLLASVGVAATALLTALFCHLALGLDALESLLIGSVISSTDAASVFSILRSKKLGLKEHTDSLLELESGSNDPASYLLTVLALTMMEGGASGAGEVALLFLRQLGLGILLGLTAGLAAAWLLRRAHLSGGGIDTVFVFGVAMLSYALTASLGGNGYLAAYLAGILLGNSELRNKRALVHFFDGITSLMQMLVFFLLGLLAFPSLIPAILPTALAISLFLALIARPVATFAILAPFRCSVRQMALVSWSGLRGAASVVFAMMAVVSPAYTKMDIFHIVFCVVLLSISIQGTLLPLVARKLGMVDQNNDVMRTFNDYIAEPEIKLREKTITPGHPWTDQDVAHLDLPENALIILIRRPGMGPVIPRGGTVIREGDVLLLSEPE